MQNKLMPLDRAVSEYIRDGDSVVLGACLESCIPFAVAHELVRREVRGLNIIAPISDMCSDLLIGAGCVAEITGAWVGNVSGGLGHNYRRAVEDQSPNPIRIHDHSNFSLGMSLFGGAYGMPFVPVRSLLGSDILSSNPQFQLVEDNQEVRPYVRVPPLNPDTAVLAVQRSDKEGNCHYWGNLGVMQEAALASEKVILVTEELVDSSVIASDPNRVPFPGFRVDAVCLVPGGAHPSPMTGCWKRDHDFFNEYHRQSRNQKGFREWVKEWVMEPKDHQAYIRKLGNDLEKLKIRETSPSFPVNYASQ